MTIALILGPSHHDSGRPPQLVTTVLSHLGERASDAGQSLKILRCQSDSEVTRALQEANNGGLDLVIFNPGDCDCARAHVHGLLKNLRMPYIEAHDDDVGALDPVLKATTGPRLTLVQGYGLQSYTVALAIALEHLGCSECDDVYHVGT